MKILSLSLRNFKRFPVADITFRDGLTDIRGSNGVGKSTIVEAIFFALFGVADKHISSDYIVSAGATGKCTVTLEFQNGGETYTLTRTFAKGKTVSHDATLQVRGQPRAAGVSAVETEIKRILGTGPVDFRSTVYAAQKELSILTDKTPGQRRDWFLRALGLKPLADGTQKLLKEENDAKTQDLSKLEGELLGLARQDPGELDHLSQEIASLETAIGITRAEIEDAKKTRGIVETRQRELFQLQARYTELTAREKGLRQELQTLQTAITARENTLTSLKYDPDEYAALAKSIGEIPAAKADLELHRQKKTRYDALTVENARAATDEEKAKTRAKEILETLLKLSGEENELNSIVFRVRRDLTIPEDADLFASVRMKRELLVQDVAQIKAKCEAAESQKKDLEETLEKLRANPDGECPFCHQKVSNHLTEIEEEFGKRIHSCIRLIQHLATGEGFLKQEAINRIDAQAHLLKDIERLSKNLAVKDHLDSECNIKTREFRAAQETGIRITRDLQELAYDPALLTEATELLRILETAQTRYNQLSTIAAQQAAIHAQLSEHRTQLTGKEKDLTGVSAEIAAMQYDPEEAGKIQNALGAVDQAILTGNTKIATQEERIRNNQALIAQLEKSAQRAAEIRAAIDALKDELDIIKLTRSVMTEYVVYLIQVVRGRIESEVSRIISLLTDGKYEQVRLDEDFSLVIKDGEDEYDLSRFSGGEQDVFAVALRIALSRYLAELHGVHDSTILIFDEILGSLDDERRINMLTTLRSLEPLFPQIFLINHLADLQGEIPNTLLVQGKGPVSTVQEMI